MTCIEFVMDRKGHAEAVLIGLRHRGRLWAEFSNNLLCEQRKNEQRVEWATVKGRLMRAGKLRG